MKKILSVLTAAVVAVGLTLSVGAAQLPATKVTAKAVSETAISLSWKKVSGAEKYNIYILKPGTSTYVNIGSVTKTTASIGKLRHDTRYRFKIVPVDVTNGRTTAGKASASVSVTTQAPEEEAVIMEETEAETADPAYAFATAEPEDVISVATAEMTTAPYAYTTASEPAPAAGAATLAGKTFYNDDDSNRESGYLEYRVSFDGKGGCTLGAYAGSNRREVKGTYTAKAASPSNVTVTAVVGGKTQTFSYNNKTKLTTVSETFFGLPKGAVLEIQQYDAE